MLCVVAALLQVLPVADDDVRVVVVPGHTVSVPVMVGLAGNGLTVTVTSTGVPVQAAPPGPTGVMVYTTLMAVVPELYKVSLMTFVPKDATEIGVLI